MNKRKIIAGCSILGVIVLVSSAYIYGGKLLNHKMKQDYISNCQLSASKNFPKSASELNESCTCSYNRLYDFLGKDTMRDFTRVVLKKNKNLTNEFLETENINIRDLDSNFLSCF